MTRFLPVSIGALCATLCVTAPAAAYGVERSTGTLVIRSLYDFDACQQEHEDSEVCLDALKAYVKRRPKDAFEAGKRARRHYMHWVALDFFVQALTSKYSKKQCADDDVSAAVLSGLALPPRYPAVELAQRLVRELCRDELESSVVAQLKDAGGYFRSNACPLVAEKVSRATCSVDAEAKGTAKQPAATWEPSAADQLAAAPRLREAHPDVKETPESTPVHRLTETFAPIPGERVAEAPQDPVAELKGLDWKLLSLDTDNAEVLRGTHGEELMIARTKPGAQAYVVLKFKGVRGPWNGRVLVAIERSDAQGKDYVAVVDQRESVVMIERQRQYQAFPKGVTGGVWFNPVRPSEPAFKLPTRRELAREFATAATPAE